MRIPRGSLWVLAVLLAVAGGCRAPKPESGSAGENVNDASITAAIKTKLIEQKIGLVTEIRVTTDHGRVVLSGRVENAQQRERAAAIVRQVEGVREVVNELRITPGD
jgi:hyperosmotically inducible protein